MTYSSPYSGHRGWVSREMQESGFEQGFAVAISIEAFGRAIAINEAIDASLELPVRVPAETPGCSKACPVLTNQGPFVYAKREQIADLRTRRDRTH